MFRTLRQIFQRYAHEHARLSKPGFVLLDHCGDMIGHIDALRLSRGQFEVEGWVDADHVALIRGKSRSECVPDLARTDVHDALMGKIGATPGFQLSMPAGEVEGFLSCKRGATQHVFPLRFFPDEALRRARRKLLWPFAATCLRVLPSGLKWWMRHNPEDRAVIKNRLGLGQPSVADDMMPYLFAEDAGVITIPPKDLSSTRVTIILPVFNALDLLPEVLDRVMAHTDLTFDLFIVEDCSTDPDVRPFLRDWTIKVATKTSGKIHLIENAENLGFIGAVNLGLEAARRLGQHVILLNSDAFVPKDWASRLIRPLLEHRKVASVTPMSNDAEIFNAPVMCRPTILGDGVGDRLDSIATQFVPNAVLVDAPTGVGFCMAMHKDALRAVPKFDRAFDPGYGEEVDWCQKLVRKGWRHLGHGGVFVEHRSGTSFGSAKKARLIAEHNKIVTQRYPNFDPAVQQFIAQDPLISARLALALTWAAEHAEGPLPIYIGHALGGGAEHYLRQRLEKDLVQTGAAVVVRVGGTQDWQVELHTPSGVTQGGTNEIWFVTRLLSLLPRRQVIYSCGVGARDMLAVPRLLCELAKNEGSTLELLFHDYLPLSPSYTLLDSAGRFSWPSEDDQGSDPAHRYVRTDGSTIPLREWQGSWGAAVAIAGRLSVFSENSREIVAATFPDAFDRIEVCPHSVALRPNRVTPKRSADGKPVIGVLGAIGMQKGAKVLQEMSHAIEKSGDAHLVLIGYMDPEYPLADSARVHGPYNVSDVPRLARRYGITCWFIPSIWPETFSYTTHEALATGLPVWSFDVGAQGDAVRRAAKASGQGGCISFDQGPPKTQVILNTILPSESTLFCRQFRFA